MTVYQSDKVKSITYYKTPEKKIVTKGGEKFFPAPLILALHHFVSSKGSPDNGKITQCIRLNVFFQPGDIGIDR